MDKNDMLLICVVLDNKNSTPCKDTLKAVNYCYEKYTRSSIDEAAAQLAAQAESEAAAQQASETETASSEEEAIRGGDQPNIAAKDSSDSNSPEDTISKLTSYIIAHPLILLAAGAGLVVLLSLILVWLVSSSERRH
jgi:hypothetical protein